MPELRAGSIAHHVDGKHHMAIVLHVSNQHAWAVFLTSNPSWGIKVRRATKDELALVGFVSRRPTYLSSVVRPRDDLEATDLEFPEHRVKDLLVEFFGGTP